MPVALIVIAIIYGLTLCGTALNNMGPAAPYFVGFVIIAVIIDKIVTKVKEKKNADGRTELK
jgi:Na+/glutamate symporter